MSENRRKILDMLANQKITTDEAERLLAALDKEPPAATRSRDSANSGSQPKYLRVVVDELEDATHKPTKVNVRMPLQLLRAGIKLQSLLPPEARADVNFALREKGFSFDLSQVKAENVDELIAAFSDLTVDVDADGGRSKVKVFCE
jgi:hypothetical protein